MQSPDVNVLVSAFRADAEHHVVCRQWLENALTEGVELGISELVLSGVLRILTHARIFDPPNTLAEAAGFVEHLVATPSVRRLRPGSGHWRIFSGLYRGVGATGNRIPDAYHAALAVEHGCRWITLDRGFAAYPGLQWMDPRTPPLR